MRLFSLTCLIILQSQCWAAQSSAPAVLDKNSHRASSIPAELVGHWFNTENNATVGLIIAADKSCQMYTERLTNPRTASPCKVEFDRDDIYLIFLKGADGQCGTSADFEFRYLRAQERLDLNAGGGANFLLEPRRESVLPGKVSKKSS